MTSTSPVSGLDVRLLTEADHSELVDLLDTDRAGWLYLRSLVHEFGITPTRELEHGRFFGGHRHRRLAAVLFVGNSQNLTTLGSPEDVGILLTRALAGRELPRLFVGPAEHAPAVRRGFLRAGTSPVLDREQIYYVLTPETLIPAEPVDLRVAEDADVSAVARAQGAMTEEDLLIRKDQLDHERLRQISRRRIAAGKVWVLEERGRLVFKTEESARAPDGIVVGGVFTEPAFRGRGYARRGIATWARHLFEREGLRYLTLHVNAANRPALTAYERVGFLRHSSLRLMLGL